MLESVLVSLAGTIVRSYLGLSPSRPLAAEEGLDEVATRQVETGRREEPIGTETRTVDNSRSASSSVRRLKARRTWTGSQEVRFEETTRKSVSGGVEVKAVVNLRGELEQAVRRSRTTVVQDERTFEEEIEVTIPARTTVDVLLHWKRVWQEGNLVVTTSSGDVFEVPYREVVGLTFDQENRDR
jgi:hypothetical protein